MLKQGYFKTQQTHALGSMDYYSWSKLNKILKSPRAFYEHYKEQKVFEPSKEMELGNLIHAAILEPKKFRDNFVIQPDFGPMQSSRNRANRDEWKKTQIQEGRLIVDEDNMEKIVKIVDRVLEHDTAKNILTGGRAEGWAYAKDEEFGRWILGRPDFLDNNLVTVEIKTTSKAIDRRSWARQVFNMGYHGQLALNCRAVSIIEGLKDYRKACWIVVQTVEPFDVAVYTASENIMLAGEAMAKAGMTRMNHFLELDPEMKNKKLWSPGIQPEGKAEEVEFEPWMVQDEIYNEINQ